MRKLLCLVLALTISLDGCALIFRGSQQPVTISCSQADAKITVDGNGALPGTMVLSRGDDHIVTANAPGYKPYRFTLKSNLAGGLVLFYSGFVYVACCFIVGIPLLIPLLIDGTTGALNSLEPEQLYIDMRVDEDTLAPPVKPTKPTDPWPPSTEKPTDNTLPPPPPASVDVKCPYCGQTIKTADKECPFCGAKTGGK